MRFIIETEHIRAHLIETIKRCPLEPVYLVEISLYEEEHSDKQRRYYWAILTQIAHFAAKLGLQELDPDVYHEHFKRQVFGRKVVEIDGEIEIMTDSSRGKSKKDFNQLTMYAERWAYDHGIELLDQLQWEEYRREHL